MFILSCSTNSDNKDLWHYYTKNSEGFGYNLSINPQTLIDEALTTKRMNALTHANYPHFYLHHGAIIYDENKQIEIFQQYLQKAIKEYDDAYDKNIILDRIVEDIVKLCFFMKSSDFINESEYRIIAILPNDKLNNFIDEVDSPHYFFVESHGAVVPRLSFDIDLDVIKQVGISPYNKMDFTELGLKSYLASQSMKCTVKKSTIKLRF